MLRTTHHTPGLLDQDSVLLSLHNDVVSLRHEVLTWRQEGLSVRQEVQCLHATMDHHAAQGRKAIRQLARLIMSVLARSSLPRSGETTAMHAQDDGSIHASANVHGVLQSIQQQLVAEVHNTVHDALQTVQGSIQQQISEQVSGLTVPASSDSDINLKLQLIIDRLVQLQQSQQQARHSSTPGQLATSWQHLNGLDEQSELANTIRNISQAGVRMPTAQQLQGMADHTPNRIMSSDNMVGSVAEPVCSHLGGGSSSSSSSRMRRTDSDTLHSTHTAGQVDSQSSGVATDHDAPSATNSPFVNSRRSRSHLPSRAQQPDPYEAARDFLASHNVQSYFKGLLYCVMISTGVWCHGLIDDIKGEPMRLAAPSCSGLCSFGGHLLLMDTFCFKGYLQLVHSRLLQHVECKCLGSLG